MDKRSKKIVQASIVGIVGNAILAIVKIIAGVISGSFAVVAHGIDSIADVATFILSWVTAKIINRPPDNSFPYGYRRAEAITTTILAFVIFFVGAQLLISSIENLINYKSHELPGTLALYITVISIIGKIIIGFWQLKIGKKVDSKMVIANAKNMFNDLYISISILIGLSFTYFLNIPIIDLILGALVSLWIIKTAIEIFLDANIELMDGLKDQALYKEIINHVNNVESVSNPHKIRIRKHGNMIVIEMDLEVPPNMSVSDAHSLSHKVEDHLYNKINNIYDIIIHIEPFGNNEKAEKFGLHENIIESKND